MMKTPDANRKIFLDYCHACQLDVGNPSWVIASYGNAGYEISLFVLALI